MGLITDCLVRLGYLILALVSIVLMILMLGGISWITIKIWQLVIGLLI